MNVPLTPDVVKDIVDNADERELWIVGREFERPPYFHAGKGGDTRLTRALRLCTDDKITPNSDGSYQVEGSAGRSYRVAESCSCPNSQKASTKYCYHFVAVCLYIEWQRRLRPVAPVELGTLRAGTLPLPPTTVDERLALGTMRDSTALQTHHTPQEDRMADNEYIPEPDTDDAPVAILDAPEATCEHCHGYTSPRHPVSREACGHTLCAFCGKDGCPLCATPAPRPLSGPVLLPALDARTLEQSMQAYAAQRAIVTRYIKEQMTEGVDYYTLTIKGRVSKATLSKAGSEKFLSLFQLHAAFQQDEATWRMLGSKEGLLCYTCTLMTRSGEVIGEGRGARSVSQDGGDINKAIKMATKCLGGTTPVLVKGPQGMARTVVNKLFERNLDDLFIAAPSGTWRKIVRVERQPGGPVRRLTFRDGLEVTASLDHRWPLTNGELVDTALLEVGDRIQRSVLPTGSDQADRDFAWMAGLYIAEGSEPSPTSVRFSLHAQEDGLAEHLCAIATRLGAISSDSINKNKRDVVLYGPAARGMIAQFVEGRLSYGKHFKAVLFQQDPKVLKAGLMGYLVGDGSLQLRDGRQPFWNLGFTRKNLDLAHDLRTICAMLGYRCSLLPGAAIETTTQKRFLTYRGWLSMLEPRYNEKYLGEIVKIEEEEAITYEIEVDGDHLFCLANGLVTHNSAQVDAVLRTGALSDVFTQDLDDAPEAQPAPAKPNPLHPSAELRQRIWTQVQKMDGTVRTREQVEAFIKARTGMDLHPDLYEAISNRLEGRA